MVAALNLKPGVLEAPREENVLVQLTPAADAEMKQDVIAMLRQMGVNVEEIPEETELEELLGLLCWLEKHAPVACQD
jgi:hypothetical protein